MGYKKTIRKIAKFILSSQPSTFVNVNVGQIQSGDMLKGKKVVITGGGSGLGFAMAKKFISEGAKVVISGRNEKKLKKAVSELGDNSHYLVYDVCDVKNCEKFLTKSSEILDGLDVLVCNAGISLHENIFFNVTEEGFDKQFDTKFKAGYFLGKSFLEMKLSDKSRTTGSELLFISSETGNQCYDIPYGLANSAVNSMVAAFSHRVYKEGIRVNAIAPGVTLTDMTKDYADSSDGNLWRDCSSGRVFLPEEVAEVACFLLSDASKCISGEIIHCNASNHRKVFWNENE